MDKIGYTQLFETKPEAESPLSYEDVTNLLQIGRDTECGRMVLDKYLNHICNNPKSKVKIGDSGKQLIHKIQNFYRKLESNDPNLDVMLEQKDHYRVDFSKEKIDLHKDVFNRIMSGQPMRKLVDLLIARDDLNRVENYAKKVGISAIKNNN